MDRFLIAPFNTGLQTNLKPFLIMDDAFTYMQNVYVFRGRIKKRFGSLLMGTVLQSRLAVNIGTVASPIIPNNPINGSSQLQIGQIFSVGSDIFTIYQLGANVATLSTNGSATATINSTTNPNTVTFTGESGSATVLWYPANPVMGITQYESGTLNNHPSYAFDTEFAYSFIPGAGWARSGTAVWNGGLLNYFWATNWQGTATTANSALPVMFVTNFNFTTGTSAPANTDDPIWYTADGSTWIPMNGGSSNGIYFLPNSGNRLSGPFVQTALMIVAYKGRLLLLNTVENNNSSGITSLGNTNGSGNFSGTFPSGYAFIGQTIIIGSSTYTVPSLGSAVSLTVSGIGTGTINTSTGVFSITGGPATTAVFVNGSGTATNYKNRCRYTWFGSPLAPQAWYEQNQKDSGGNIGAGAGFNDAPTQEAIVSCEFVKDRLIVYFEQSAYELAYTNIETDPFQWNKLNTELGSQSTFSTVPFDKECITIGDTGIHACNGSNVIRIDNKIPQEIFDNFKTSDEVSIKVHGIRDYFNEVIYWSFMNNEVINQNFPNQILVYNYENKSWAVNDDCFLSYGYFEQQTDLIWSNATMPWYQATFSWTDNIIHANQREIIAGTPDGFILRISDDSARNAPSIQITKMTIPGTIIPSPSSTVDIVAINHNLAVDDYIAIENAVGITLTFGIYQVFHVTDANTFTIYATDISGIYLGGGTIARVSNLQFTTKQINPYDKEGSNIYLQKVDFLVEKTSSGQITVDYFASASEESTLTAAQITNSAVGTGILETSPYDPTIYPMEQVQDRLTHPIYFQTTGTCIQLDFYFSDNQMTKQNIVWSDFELDGMILTTDRAGRMQ